MQYSTALLLCVCYRNMLLQYSTVCVCVTLIFCYSTVEFNTPLLLCVGYCNVLATIQYSTTLLLCVRVTLTCCYNTVKYSVPVHQ